MILFNEFKREYEILREEIEQTAKQVLASGWYILGKEVDAFEKEFAAYVGVSYCVGVANGTEAIALALNGMNIGMGDEVITTNITAYPTITGIVQSGATPIVVDIFSESGLMNYNLIEQKISSRTKAIVPVHLYGQCCDMEPIRKIADQYGLKIMEDCAQATGAKYRKRMAGTWGDCAAFSFYPTKNLGAYGDAGAIVTNDKVVYEQLVSLRNYGQTKRYYHDVYGINSRLDEMQAAFLRVKLKYLDSWNQRRGEIAFMYRKGLENVDCLIEHEYGETNNHLFVIKTPFRNELMDWLNQKGIQTLIHYPVPINKQKAFTEQKNEEMPESERFASSILSLPMYPTLKNEEIDSIIQTINSFKEI